MVDPDTTNQDNQPMDSDDTKTRKTVRLRPSAVTPGGINLSKPAPISDPLSGRDTDTGNLEVMEDTQTRKTVKLKPIAPPSAGPAVNIQPGASATAKPAGDGANTQTRKTIVLKPTAVSPASLKVDKPGDGDDTQTRKTVKLRPSVAAPTQVKVAPGISPMAKPAAQDEDCDPESSDTIKITRPPRAPINTKPADASKATMILSALKTDEAHAAHSLPAAKPLPEPAKELALGADDALKTAAGASAATARPAAPEPVLKPVTTKTPAVPKEDEELTLKEVKKPAAKEEPAADAKAIKGKAPVKVKPMTFGESEDEPSKLYLVLAAVSLLLVIGTVTITTIQYLNLHQQQNIELPGLPKAK